ncbi:hypothetical protein CGRA01v4_13999 [Colletotrichum graminicola]|nr:hypothetical protein CGRA01v4_13999 [Colletotrichum graminicola]
MAPPRTKTDSRTSLSDVETDVTKTTAWAAPKDTSMLSAVDQMLLNNMEILAKQNNVIMSLLLQSQREGGRIPNMSKTPRRNDAKPASDSEEEAEHIDCLKEKYTDILFRAYRDFTKSTKKTPFIKRGSTKNLEQDVADFKEHVLNHDWKGILPDWSTR